MNFIKFLVKIFNKILLKILTFLKMNNNHQYVVDGVPIDIRLCIPEKDDSDLKLPQIRIIEQFDPKKQTVLIIDDSKGIVSIVEDYLLECNITSSDYNIITFFGQTAPFILINTLKELKRKGLTCINFAVIDIVLPGKVKYKSKYIKMDGIDVSIILNEEYNCNNFCFYTGNIVNSYVDFIQHKANKFFNYFRCDIVDFLIYKGGSTDNEMLTSFTSLINKTKYKVN